VRCLFIVAQYPISPNYRGGGSATFYERLSSLRALGHEMHLWHYAYPEQRRAFDSFVETDAETYRRVQQMCESVQLTTFPLKAGLVDRVRARLGDLTTGTYVENPIFRTLALRQLQERIDRVNPQFIWAHHFGPARIATLQDRRPVIYSHHDWLYKVRALANAGPINTQLQRQEEDVARAAAGVVSGSFTECEQLRHLGCREVAYIPVAYDRVAGDGGDEAGPPRIVHLGGMATTANRLGLQRFFDVVWPALPREYRNLWVIGDVSAAGPALTRHLQTVTCTGYVSDLRPVMRPFDLHIIPWEHDTGQRTRLPMIFSYQQVVVGVKAAVACFPEVRDGENCRLVDRLDQMPGVIQALLRDDGERRRLGYAARHTFEQSFTRTVLMPRYAAIVEAVAGRPRFSSSRFHGEPIAGRAH
jgi:glycosyltransferase involved in cell wall biosynthesis